MLQTPDVINMNSTNTTFNASGNTLTITNTNAFPAANIKCKVTTTVTRTASNQIPKTAQLASVCIVDNDGVAGAAAYGTSAHHKDVSLGVADAYKLWAVFDSEDSTLLMQSFLNLLSLVYLVYSQKVK